VPKVRVGKYAFELPRNRAARIGLGTGLVVGGGLFANDVPPIRRFNRRASVALVGWWKGRKPRDKRRREAP
jgi:hypothetical protein